MWSRDDSNGHSIGNSVGDSVTGSGSDSDSNATDPGSDHETPRNGRRQQCRSRNAVLARKNRKKKKEYLQKLENNVKRLEAENESLRSETQSHGETVRLLRRHTRYLEAVLNNSSELSSLLGAVRSCGLPVASSLLTRQTHPPTSPTPTPPPPPTQGNPPPQPDHIYSKTRPTDTPLWLLHSETLCEDLDAPTVPLFDFNLEDEPIFPDAGICLHVAKHRVSLEFCSSCHSNAEEAWDDAGS